MEGWIKLHREIIDHWIYQDAEYLKVWMEMLIRARYWDEPSMELVGDQLIKVDRGEFIFGRPKWSQRLGISEQRLKTLIKKMLKDDMIELVQKYPRSTLYRIKNYEKFNQHDNQQTNQQEDQSQSGFADDGNQQDNQQSNQRPTSNQPATNQQSTNNKESKESKNEKKEELKPIVDSDECDIAFQQFWDVYPTKGSNKKMSNQKWATLWKNKKIKTQEVLDGVKRYVAYQKHHGYSICAAQVFLNQERWRDEWGIEGGKTFGKHEGLNDRLTSQSKFAAADKNKPFDPRELEELGLR